MNLMLLLVLLLVQIEMIINYISVDNTKTKKPHN